METNRYFLGETEEDYNMENREFVLLEQVPFERMKMVDGCAAGGVWVQLSPLDGAHVGKKLWFEDITDGQWQYHAGKTDDDGFIFNGDEGEDGAYLGDSVQELDGVVVTLCTPECEHHWRRT